MNEIDTAFRDMRSHDRFEVKSVVHVTDLLSGRELGRLVNYSEQGIMIVGTQAIAENSVFQLSLALENATSPQTIELGVESLWSNTNHEHTCYWTGFYIIDISPESLTRLTTLLG
jgi:PilZ domain